MNVEDINELLQRIKKCAVNAIFAIKNEETEVDVWGSHISEVLEKANNENQELMAEISKLDVNCNDVKLTCDTMAKTLVEKQNELKTLQTELGNSENQLNLLEKELEKIDEDCIKTKKQCEPTTADKQVLDLARTKLELYEKMTNIVWDYTVPLKSAITRGYVRNKENKYLNAFEFKRENSSDDLSDKIWQQIELGAGEEWCDIVAMTNLNIPKHDQ